MKPREQKIEALLFYKNEPVSYTWLGKVLGISKNEVKETLAAMGDYYQDRGIALVSTDDEVSLMTSPIGSEIIADLAKTQEEKELSKQALETLAIIMYKGKVTKSEIDYIRGVNSVFILRNLLIRGLITKKQNLLDRRSPLYVPTHDMLSYLGITDLSLLPDFETIDKKLQELEGEYFEEQKNTEPIVVGGDKE